MSDGATTNTTTCTNCNEQDTITIAGKIFCANCGTPQPAGAPPVVAGVAASLSTDSHDQSTNAIPAERMPSVGGAPSITHQPAAPVTSSSPTDSQGDTIVQTRLKADQMHSALSTEQSPSIVKFAATTATTGIEGDDATTSDKASTEFSNLDDKSGETVMSDETLEELSKTAGTPMPKDEPEPTIGPSPSAAAATASGLGMSSAPVADQSSSTKSTSGAMGTTVLENSSVEAAASTPVSTPGVTAPTGAVTASPAQPTVAQESTPTMPRESSYKLDLTQAKSSSLPRAVSDVRPAAAPAVSAPAPVPVAALVAPPTPSTPLTPTPAVAPTTPSPVMNSAPVAPSVAPPTSVAPAQSAPAPYPAQSPQPATIAQPASPVAPTVQASTPAVASVMANSASAGGAPVAPGASVGPAVAPAKGLKASSVALSLVGLLLIGGYIWQVNYPNLALKVAGSKAGISANFPGYVPNGWKLSGNIQSSPGNISYNIANTKDNKSLQVSESKTEWDSQALAENYVAPKASNYLALQAQGLTIYLYDGNQASWVNNGTWYRIEGDAKGLSQDQVIKVATSL